MEDAVPVDQPVAELTLILQLEVPPAIDAFAIELGVFELAFVDVTICAGELATTLNHVGEHLALVHCQLTVHCWFWPCQLPVSVHLRVDELPDVVAAIRPLEFAVTIDLRLLKISLIDEVLRNFGLARLGRSFDLFYVKCSPLLCTFAVDVLTIEVTFELDFTPPNLLDTLASHFISHPVASVFRAVFWLRISSLPVEKAFAHRALIDRSVGKRLLTPAFRLVVVKRSRDTRPILVQQRTLTVLDAVLPAAFILRAIAPVANPVAIHAAHLPLTVVLPSLLLTQKHPFAILKPIGVVAFVEVSVLPLADALPVREAVGEVTYVDLVLLQSQLSETFHRAIHPVAHVCLFVSIFYNFRAFRDGIVSF